jgi:hypothetical protein
MSIRYVRYVLPSAFALAIALGLSFGPVQAAEGDMARGAASPKMDTRVPFLIWARLGRGQTLWRNGPASPVHNPKVPQANR